MSKTAVVYHSGYGHTQRVAQTVAEGADAHLVAIDAEGNVSEADWAAINAADAIIFGSPTYMGVVSWQFKKIRRCHFQAMDERGLERQGRRRIHDFR